MFHEVGLHGLSKGPLEHSIQHATPTIENIITPTKRQVTLSAASTFDVLGRLPSNENLDSRRNRSLGMTPFWRNSSQPDYVEERT